MSERRLNLKDLEETKIYYEKELKDEELTGGERNSYLKALKLIKRFIKIEKEAGEIERINLLPKKSIKGGFDYARNSNR